MSKNLERKYSYKSIILIVVVFLIAAGVNLVPRKEVVSSPCEGAAKAEQSVRTTRTGLPFAYSTKMEPLSICLKLEGGKLEKSAIPETTHELNVFALIVNEVVIVGGMIGLVTLVARTKGKKHVE